MRDAFLINATNLHIGGGVQVAVSFLHEILQHQFPTRQLTVRVSSEVDEAMRALGCETSKFLRYELVNTHGLDLRGVELVVSCVGQGMGPPDAVLTVFGPLYRWRCSFRNIVGFAQPWIIYPDNECYRMLPLMRRVLTRVTYFVQGLFFKRADVLIVELDHVKERLIEVLGVECGRIHVVRNCISSIYLDESLWRPVDVPKLGAFLRLGFLGRNYLHKNTRLFPDVVAALEETHGIQARFYVTFTEQEWIACSPAFRRVCVNVGPLAVSQCPLFYSALDGVVFPSLLECFSATPLEAMAMERPLFASDRPFNRDICGSHAHYFDPLSAASAAQSIARVFATGGPSTAALRAARYHAIHFSNPKERAEQYLALLMSTGR